MEVQKPPQEERENGPDDDNSLVEVQIDGQPSDVKYYGKTSNINNKKM